MSHARRRLGDRGEHLAESYLVDHGYEPVARNYSCAAGEVDLVCRAGDVLVFVEVKTRRGIAFGIPEEAVTPAKIAHIAAAAQHYLAEHELDSLPWRIDVVAVQLDRAGRIDEIRLIAGVGDW
jgi:putative endonuclease